MTARRRLAPLAAIAALTVLPLPAQAHDLTPESTSIESMVAIPSAGGIDVAGIAAFGGQRLLRLGTDPAGDAFGGISEVDLTEVKLAQLDPASRDLNFVFKLADLPATGGVPEAAEYLWEFGIPGQPATFRIQTSFTNVSGLSPEPWALLHACTTTCGATAIVAEYVGLDNEIFVDVPWSLLETKLGRTPAGLAIAADEGSGAVETSLAYGEITGDSLNAWTTYQIASPRVDVGLAVPNGQPAATVPAQVTEEGDFSASLDTAGLAAGAYDVVGRACFGTNCATYRQRITL